MYIYVHIYTISLYKAIDRMHASRPLPIHDAIHATEVNHIYGASLSIECACVCGYMYIRVLYSFAEANDRMCASPPLPIHDAIRATEVNHIYSASQY